MNLKPNQRLPLLTQHINAERCLCLQGYALGNQYVVRELIMAMPEENGEEGNQFRLKKLDIALSESFVNQIIASGLDAERENQTLSHLCFCFLDDTRILSRLLINDDKTILALSWRTHIIGSKQIEFQLDSVMPLGNKQISSLDSCYDAIGVALGCLDKLGMRHFYRYIKNTIRIDIVESICHTIFNESPEYEIFMEGGGLHLSKDGSDIHLVYDESYVSNTSQIEKPNHELVEIYDWPDDEEEAASKEVAEPYTKASKLKAISKLQQIIYANKPLTLPIAVAALEEAKTELHPALTPALLYIIHKYEPGHDDALKLQTLSANAASQNDFLIYKILESVYRKQKNDTILLELKQRVLKRSEHTPRRAIDTGIEVADILAQNMGHYTQAIKRLDDMKLRVSMHGTNSQKLTFAEAYHRAQGTSMAIHLLRQYMNQSTKAEEIAEFGYAVAKMMVEHNEPPQSIINACASVLEQVPGHLGTQKIFANCLKSCGRLEDAAFAYELILDQLSLDYESEVAREKLAYLPKSEKSTKAILREAIKTAETLEDLYSLLEREPQKCIVLKQHLRLKPDDITVLSKLLKHFESIFYYDEMVQVCYDFLEQNQDNLNPDYEISIRLTLHNIFDQKILRPEEALFHLSKARELAALDPRVLLTEIERYKRRGLKQEQIGLRLALIDVLPADEAVEQALELVRLYEELGPNIAEISTVLRKAQSLNPQHRDVLLELRHYLRKSGQFFELASVLEKLARVTNDNQSRKSILLEASETHQKLENQTLAKKLYNEAQLCSPINPDLKADYLPEFLGNSVANHNDEMWQTLFSAESQADASLNFGTSDAAIDDKYHHVLTSRSLSLVAETTESTDEHKVSDSQKSIPRLTASEAPPLARFRNARRRITHPEVETTLTLDNTEIDESAPLEQQITQARLKGNTKALLERLIKSVEDVEAKEQQPRILLEIGCLYLYDFNNYETAKIYLERAASLSPSVAEGEQTVNALEMIYKTLEQYKELAQIYEKKRDISTIPLEKKRYEILAAQLYYMHLGDTQKAIDTLERTLDEAPNNESALQLLAQIYVDTQDYDKAIEYLNKISKLLKQGSKVHAQHLLRLVALYTKANKIEEAKVCLRQLLRDNNHVDKLAVIEQFKRICRLNDQWEELLEILNDELCYYLHLSRETFSLDLFTEDEHPEIPFGYAAHTIREYADVLYYKLENITSSVKLYRTLAILHPEDNYSSEMLRDIAESHPKSSEAIEALITAYHPDFLHEKSLELPLTTLSSVSHSGLSIIDSNDSFEQLGEAYKCYKKGEISKAKELLSSLESNLLGHKKTRQISLLIEVVKNHWTALEEKPKQDTDHDGESESKESDDLTEKPLLEKQTLDSEK